MVCAQRKRQSGNCIGGKCVSYDQAPLGMCGQAAQIGVQFHQRFPDERHAAISPRQGIQNGPIQNKYAMHGFTLRQCRAQRGVVFCTQVTPEPNQTHFEKFFHCQR